MLAAINTLPCPPIRCHSRQSPMRQRQCHPPPFSPICRDHHLLSSLCCCHNLVHPPIPSHCRQLDMWHHHHRPRRPRRTHPPVSGESPPAHCHVFTIATAIAVLCSQPVPVITVIRVDSEWAVSSPCSCCQWGQGTATLPEPPLTCVVAIAGGALAAVLLPARVNALSQSDTASAAPARAHLVEGWANSASTAVAAARCLCLLSGGRW